MAGMIWDVFQNWTSEMKALRTPLRLCGASVLCTMFSKGSADSPRSVATDALHLRSKCLVGYKT